MSRMRRCTLALLSCSLGLSTATHPASASEMPKDFAYLRDVDPTIQQDMRYAGADNFTGRPVPGYDAPECVLVRQAAEALKAVDVLVGPTTPITAPAVQDFADDDSYGRLNMLALKNTAVVSFLGLCALSLPIGHDAAGMPIGLQLVARAMEEPKLLAVAAAFERAFAQAGLWAPPASLD